MAEVKKEMEALREELLAQIKEEAQAEAQKIIEEAQAQAESLIKSAAKPAADKPKGETKAQIEKANELVTIKLFKDKGKYAADVTVIHNGKSWLIKRGVEVQVPRKVAQIIADSEAQKGYTADLIEGYKSEGKEADEKLR